MKNYIEFVVVDKTPAKKEYMFKVNSLGEIDLRRIADEAERGTDAIMVHVPGYVEAYLLVKSTDLEVKSTDLSAMLYHLANTVSFLYGRCTGVRWEVLAFDAVNTKHMLDELAKARKVLRERDKHIKPRKPLTVRVKAV